MNKNKYLFEIGTEEIPAGYINPGMKAFVEYFREQLKSNFLTFEKIQTFSTPRRLTIKISGLPVRQKDRVEELKGPPQKIAYDENGNLTKAGQGFLQSNNLAENNIEFKELKRGVYLYATKKIAGKATPEILTAISREVVEKISFPKNMRWGDDSILFARPIRWLLALFNDKVVKFQINGVTSDRFTYGNRFEKLHNNVEVRSCDDYEQTLENHFVIPDYTKRKSIISNQIEKLCRNKSEEPVKEEGLLEIVTNLVEYPFAVSASYEEKFLKLPKLVIQSTLTEHQRYFAIKKRASKTAELKNKFIFISNGNPKRSEEIKYGNECVLNARLEDAEFYFREDTKQSLESFVPKLKDILFQEKLGSLLDKTERIEKLAEFLADELCIDNPEKRNVLRAAKLCKADLATKMIGEKEFTKLQGYMGNIYAKLSGENEQVAKAIQEHYNYELADIEKMSLSGALVSLADNLDTVCGIMGIGMLPTGSRDPFALRRAGNTVVQILDIQNFEVNLKKMIDKSFKLLSSKLENLKHREEVVDFFAQRVQWLLKQKGIDYDVAAAVMSPDFSNVPDLIKRAKHLHDYKSHPDFRNLIVGFRRASNILESSPQSNIHHNLKGLITHGEKKKAELNPELFQKKEEKDLYNKLEKIKLEYLQNVKKRIIKNVWISS